MNNRAFSKIWIVVILLALITGGILAWQYLGVSKEKAKGPEEYAEFTITSPTKGEKWITGETYQIRWTPSDSTKRVGIMLSDTRIPTASLSKVWQVENIPDTGNYSFIVPEVSTGDAYQIYISSKEKYGYSELFSIISKDETADWKTYRNEEYKFEFKYPETWFRYDTKEVEPLINVILTSSDSKMGMNLISYAYSKNYTPKEWAEEITIEENFPYIIKRITDIYLEDKPAIVSLTTWGPVPPPDWEPGFEEGAWTAGIEKAVFFSCKDLICCIKGSFSETNRNQFEPLFDQVLSTLKFIEVTAEGLPEEIRNNKDFIDWIKDWQAVKPTYTVDKFTKVNETLFSLNGDTINTEELERAVEGIESPYFSEERRKYVKIYSPDRTKFIFNAGYPDPLEIDQDVVLFNLSTEKYQFLKTCGTACWFEKVFWINNNQFVVIRTGEYSFTEEYEHSIFLYDLEENIVMEYKSSEKISTEELKKK